MAPHTCHRLPLVRMEALRFYVSSLGLIASGGPLFAYFTRRQLANGHSVIMNVLTLHSGQSAPGASMIPSPAHLTWTQIILFGILAVLNWSLLNWYEQPIIAALRSVHRRENDQ